MSQKTQSVSTFRAACGSVAFLIMLGGTIAILTTLFTEIPAVKGLFSFLAQIHFDVADYLDQTAPKMILPIALSIFFRKELNWLLPTPVDPWLV